MQSTTNQNKENLNFNSGVNENQTVDLPLVITEADIDELFSSFIQ